MLTDTGINDASEKILECRQVNIMNTALLNLLYAKQKEITVVPVSSNSNFILFPSPVKDVLFIKIGNQQLEQAAICIYDLSGRLIINTIPNNPNNDIHINVSSLLPGCYIIKLFEGRKLIYTTKFIKD